MSANNTITKISTSNMLNYKDRLLKCRSNTIKVSVMTCSYNITLCLKKNTEKKEITDKILALSSEDKGLFDKILKKEFPEDDDDVASDN